MQPFTCTVQFRTKEFSGSQVSTGVLPRCKNLWEDGAFWFMCYQLWWEKGMGVHEENGEEVPGQGLPKTMDKECWDDFVSTKSQCVHD